MYVLHGRILSLAEEIRIPQALHAKIASQIFFDFLITLIPILGIFFSYMNQCSTRNAAMIFNHMNKQIQKDHQLGIQRIDDRYTMGQDWDSPPQWHHPLANVELEVQQPLVQHPKSPKHKKIKNQGPIVPPQEVGVIRE